MELFDTNNEYIYPCGDPDATPPDFVPKMSNIACVLQCGGVWIGGKGWGITWKMIQGVVKPRVNTSLYGKCHIQLSDGDKEKMNSDNVVANNDAVADDVVVDTVVDDSDEDEDDEEATVESAPAPAPVKKKVVKKKVAQEVPADDDAKPAVLVKKKVIKKKVAAAA